MLEPNNTPSASVNADFFKRSKPPPPQLIVPTGHVLFRLLCHSSRIGGVIGKSGAIIKQLQHDTSSRIRVEALPHGSSDERVIIVIASNVVCRKIALEKEEESDVSSAQEAVVRVFERIIDVAAETDGGVSVASGGVVSCRLLAESGQAGAVIGKGGKVVEKIRMDTGCKIRVLSSDKSPPYAEIVEIEGDILGVKKALVAVSRCLQDCSPVDRVKPAGSRPREVIPQVTLQDLRVDLPPQRSLGLSSMSASSSTYASGGRPLRESDRAATLELRTQPQEVSFRLLCSSDRVGGVIGKGGTIVRALQNETGASIIVGDSVEECDERLITVKAMENPESRYSPAQNAVVLVFNRSTEAVAEKGLHLGPSKGSPLSARVVVPSNQVGCLLGKGGTIVSEMRKTTGTFIRIIGNDQAPKCTSQNDCVVQITGEFVNVQDALNNVTGRLRDNLFSMRISNGAGTKSSSSVITESSPYGRARDPSSMGLHRSVGVSHNPNMHAITHSMDQLGLSHHIERPQSPLWEPLTVARKNPRSVEEVGKGLTPIKGGIELGSGGRSAIVTNTTVEITVPKDVIASVYGENGSNLARLRQISGAKVVVHEPPHPGTTDRMVVISGTPSETLAAQSLLQAFIVTGSS